MVETLGGFLELGGIGLAELTVLGTDIEDIGKCVEIDTHLVSRKNFFP